MASAPLRAWTQSASASAACSWTDVVEAAPAVHLPGALGELLEGNIRTHRHRSSRGFSRGGADAVARFAGGHGRRDWAVHGAKLRRLLLPLGDGASQIVNRGARSAFVSASIASSISLCLFLRCSSASSASCPFCIRKRFAPPACEKSRGAVDGRTKYIGVSSSLSSFGGDGGGTCPGSSGAPPTPPPLTPRGPRAPPPPPCARVVSPPPRVVLPPESRLEISGVLNHPRVLIPLRRRARVAPLGDLSGFHPALRKTPEG